MHAKAVKLLTPNIAIEVATPALASCSEDSTHVREAETTRA